MTKYSLILPIYVDDLFPIGDKTLTDNFEKWIGNYFEITPPVDAHYFLSIRVTCTQTPNNSYLTLDQTKFIESILLRVTKLLKTYPTPFSSKELVSNPEPREMAKEETVQTYQSVIGSLMYVMLGTWPNLIYAVGKLACFSVNPSPNHFSAILQTFGYLKSTADAQLVYHQVNVSSPGPHSYTDADFTGDHTDAKSTSGYVFFLGDTTFSWSSKKQEAISTSIMEAEYTLGAEGQKPRGQIEIFFWSFKQFTHKIPRGQVLDFFEKSPPLWSQLDQWANCEYVLKEPIKMPMRHILNKFLKELRGFFHNLPRKCLSHSS